jgi:uncharacterized protein GlcG (DUF336 family)
VETATAVCAVPQVRVNTSVALVGKDLPASTKLNGAGASEAGIGTEKAVSAALERITLASLTLHFATQPTFVWTVPNREKVASTLTDTSEAVADDIVSTGLTVPVTTMSV